MLSKHFFFCYSPIFLAICKSRNGGSGWNNVRIPGIRVRMRGIRGVGGGMRGIRREMRGIRVIRVEMSEGNEGKDLEMCESEWKIEEYGGWGWGCRETGGNVENRRTKGITAAMIDNGKKKPGIIVEMQGIRVNIWV